MHHHKQWHRHTHLIGGIAWLAQRYPPKLVRAVVKALRDQLVYDGVLVPLEGGKFRRVIYSISTAGPVPEEPEDILEHWKPLLEAGGQFWDDVDGGFLDPIKQ